METNESSAIPSYMLAADTHNIANKNDSFFDSVTLGTAAVLGSAAVQVYNILPTIGNMLGGDFEQAKTKDILQDFDSDLGNYYSRHQEGVDALGFVVSSIVPGTVGVKFLRAGQGVLRGAMEAGTLGKNMQAATGLLPTQPKLLSSAIEAALKPNAGFPVWNSETVKAVAMGFGQAALEGAAFETAVAATMYNSPVLEKQDLGDITSNILWGAGIAGAVGGALNTAVTYSKIKSAGKALDKEMMNVTMIREISGGSKSDQILNYLDDIRWTKSEAPLASTWTGENAWKMDKFNSLREEKLRYIDDKVRKLTGEMANGDQTLAEHYFNTFKKLEVEAVEAKVFGTEEISRLGQKTKAEQRFDKIKKELGTTLDIDKLAPEDKAFYLSREKNYMKLYGEDAGKVTPELPHVWNLGDRLKLNMLGNAETISITVKGVQAGKHSYAFKADKVWDIGKTDHFESEARQLWAMKGLNWEKQLKAGEQIKVGSTDIPLLDKAYREGVLPVVQVASKKGTTSLEFASQEEFLSYLESQKKAIFSSLVEGGRNASEAAKIVNVNEKYLAGIQKGSLEDNLFAYQKLGRDFEQSFAESGRQAPGNFWDQPTWGKVIKDTTAVKDVDGNIVKGLVAIKEKWKQYEDGANVAVAPIFGADVEHFYRLSNTDLNKATRVSVGGGMFTSQSENYGTLASMCQNLGSQTLKLISKYHTATRDTLNPTLYKLAQNEAAAVEWSVLQANIRKYGSVPFGYDAEQQAMRPLALMKYERQIAEGVENVKVPLLPEDIPLMMPIKNAETAEMVAQHIAMNGERGTKIGNIRKNQGVTWNRDPERFYPIPPNTKDYPFIASVIDDSIAGHGHGKMLYAATSEELEQMITQVRQADATLKVLTKSDAENWYKSVGQYEFERTLTDVTFDSALKFKGTSSMYLPATDPKKIIADTLNWHLARDSAMVREGVAHLNEAQFATLRTLGEKFANVTDSHFDKLDPIAYLEMQGKNPYSDYAKAALGLSTTKDFPFWTPLNDMLDRKVSAVFNKVYEAFSNAKSPDELLQINKNLADAGYEGAAYTAMTVASANHTAPKGALTAFVAKANAILSSCMLGLDPINAVTNMVGSTVLRNTELQSLLRAIASENVEAAGMLARIKVPGTQDTVFSPAKMIAKAMGEFHSDSGKLLREEFKGRGIISSRVEQANWVLDNLALTGKESVTDLDSKINKVFSAIKNAAAKGEKLTGNTLAEEFNRFVSGHVAKQITDLAVEQGLIGKREAWAYINTFVNRVEGNYIAAQRPGVFQGPIGQAIGLFQTYQFNLAQQLLRHVGEGGAKDAALMMGLQSTIFGMKGLPAFDAINTHIIGNASGNKNHRDLYDATFGAFGKEAGDWLMYGTASNALGLISPDLKLNLYSRGDINPRNVTLLPVNPANIPFVQASAKFFAGLQETSTKIAQGGNVWNSFLQGIEHSGVNRPLAGLAQTLEALGNTQGRSYSTSNKGNIVASNDFLSLANMIRIAGAKPLDEAIGIDRAYNLDVYATKDAARRRVLGETMKTTMMAGDMPTTEQVEKFSYLYAKAGGRQESFNQFMMQQMKTANTSQVNKLASDLKSPFAQSMQTVMGGMRFQDFNNSPGN